MEKYIVNGKEIEATWTTTQVVNFMENNKAFKNKVLTSANAVNKLYNMSDADLEKTMSENLKRFNSGIDESKYNKNDFQSEIIKNFLNLRLVEFNKNSKILKGDYLLSTDGELIPTFAMKIGKSSDYSKKAIEKFIKTYSPNMDKTKLDELVSNTMKQEYKFLIASNLKFDNNHKCSNAVFFTMDDKVMKNTYTIQDISANQTILLNKNKHITAYLYDKDNAKAIEELTTLAKNNSNIKLVDNVLTIKQEGKETFDNVLNGNYICVGDAGDVYMTSSTNITKKNSNYLPITAKQVDEHKRFMRFNGVTSMPYKVDKDNENEVGLSVIDKAYGKKFPYKLAINQLMRSIVAQKIEYKAPEGKVNDEELLETLKGVYEKGNGNAGIYISIMGTFDSNKEFHDEKVKTEWAKTKRDTILNDYKELFGKSISFKKEDLDKANVPYSEDGKTRTITSIANYCEKVYRQDVCAEYEKLTGCQLNYVSEMEKAGYKKDGNFFKGNEINAFIKTKLLEVQNQQKVQEPQNLAQEQ